MKNLELKFKEYCKKTKCYSECNLKVLCNTERPRSSEAFVAFILLEHQKREQEIKDAIDDCVEEQLCKECPQIITCGDTTDECETVYHIQKLKQKLFGDEK